MTLHRLGLLMRRREETERRMDLRFGVLATVIARANGARNVKPDDFFPAPKTTGGRMDPTTAQAKAEKLRAWLQQRGLGG